MHLNMYELGQAIVEVRASRTNGAMDQQANGGIYPFIEVMARDLKAHAKGWIFFEKICCAV